MYLISLYFDDKTNKKIKKLIDKVAEESENKYMIEENVPPHITISAFETDEEEKVIESLDLKLKDIKEGDLQWVSIGAFNSRVIFLSVVLNQYLHKLSLLVYEGVESAENVSVSRFYKPLQWLPHTTIGKKLSQDQTLIAFKTLQNNFEMFSGTVTRIGLSKTKPYEEIKEWILKDFDCGKYYN